MYYCVAIEFFPFCAFNKRGPIGISSVLLACHVVVILLKTGNDLSFTAAIVFCGAAAQSSRDNARCTQSLSIEIIVESRAIRW